MKKILTLTLVLLLALCAALTACTQSRTNPFDSAIYTEDTTLGEGALTYTLQVIVEENTVTFTIRTDKTNLGEAFRESGIVEGDNGQFGLYIKKVNGIVADYDINASWWELSVNGEACLVGADGITLEDGDRYELTYSK